MQQKAQACPAEKAPTTSQFADTSEINVNDPLKSPKPSNDGLANTSHSVESLHTSDPPDSDPSRSQHSHSSPSSQSTHAVPRRCWFSTPSRDTALSVLEHSAFLTALADTAAIASIFALTWGAIHQRTLGNGVDWIATVKILAQREFRVEAENGGKH